MEKVKNTDELLHGRMTMLLLKYMLPGLTAAAVTFVFGLFDTMFIGRYIGELGLAALNLSVPVFAIQLAPAVLFGIGGATLGAIASGKGEGREQNIYFTLCFIAVLAVGLLEALLGLLFLEDIARALGANDESLKLTMDYMRPLFIASPFFCLQPLLSSFIRNDNDPKIVMWASVLGSLINIFLDYLAVVVLGWSCTGAASATATSMAIIVTIHCVHFFKKSNSLRLVRPEGIKRVYRAAVTGLPSFVLELCGGLGVFLYNNRLMRFSGNKGIASFAVCTMTSWLTGTFVNGIGQGAQPIISTNFGAGDFKRVRKARNSALTLAFCIAALVFAAGQLFSVNIIIFFIDADRELLDVATRGIRIYTFGLPFSAVGIILATYLQSMGFARGSTAIQLGRGVVFVAILLFILPNFLGASGVFATAPGAEFLSAALAIALSVRMARRAAKSGGANAGSL
ncbi:MAG: MATE family efflux transporter [Oscillospiraceae bacterium]